MAGCLIGLLCPFYAGSGPAFRRRSGGRMGWVEGGRGERVWSGAIGRLPWHREEGTALGVRAAPPRPPPPR
jgi:hypothetical protein